MEKPAPVTSLDYETPRPPEKVGFFSKCNPKATLSSVIRKAGTMAIGAAAVWSTAAYFKPEIRHTWWSVLPGIMCLSAFAGAVCEWQIDNDSL